MSIQLTWDMIYTDLIVDGVDQKEKYCLYYIKEGLLHIKEVDTRKK